MELFISMSCVPTSASMSKFVIVSSSSPNLTSWLCALYGLAADVIFAALSLILNYPGLKLAVDIYRGLPMGRPLPCVPYDPYVPYNPCVAIWSSNIARRRFWPVKAWDGWPSPLLLKVGNVRKAPVSP